MGAVISRLSRCLRSTLGVRRSAKVAMVQILKASGQDQDAKAGGGEREGQTADPGGGRERPVDWIGGAPSDLGGDVLSELLLEVCKRHHAEIPVAPGAHRNGPACLFLVANDKDERNLLQ